MQDFFMLNLVVHKVTTGIQKVKFVRCCCCCSVQKFLPSCLTAENIKIKICINAVFPALCGCETWSLTLREEYSLREFENRVLRKI
jgi:hypothetical protein